MKTSCTVTRKTVNTKCPPTSIICLWCNLPLRLFLSPPLPSPVTATSCYVVTGEDFVCFLGGWKDSRFTTGMLGKWLNWMPWNGLQEYCLLFLNFTFLTDACFQGEGELVDILYLCICCCLHFASPLLRWPNISVFRLKGFLCSLPPTLTSCCVPTKDPVHVWHLALHSSREMVKLSIQLFKGQFTQIIIELQTTSQFIKIVPHYLIID